MVPSVPSRLRPFDEVRVDSVAEQDHAVDLSRGEAPVAADADEVRRRVIEILVPLRRVAAPLLARPDGIHDVRKDRRGGDLIDGLRRLAGAHRDVGRIGENGAEVFDRGVLAAHLRRRLAKRFRHLGEADVRIGDEIRH
jgi:hypothetical protein